MENLTNGTPPKKGFWTPPRTVRSPPPSGVSALFFLYKNPRQSRPEALLEGSKISRGSAFSGTFSSPHTFCTPPYHRPIIRFSLSMVRTPQLESQSMCPMEVGSFTRVGSFELTKLMSKQRTRDESTLLLDVWDKVWSMASIKQVTKTDHPAKKHV